jgi:ATP-dependent RNA helicase DDX42
MASDDEIDPLDAFMLGINADVQKAAAAVAEPSGARDNGARDNGAKRRLDDDDDDDDHVASFMEARARHKAAQDGADSDDEAGGGGRGGAIEPLPPIDHTLIAYAPFVKALYTPSAELAAETADATEARRGALNLTVRGFDVPAPLRSFDECECLNVDFLRTLAKLRYDAPTAVQAQVLPVALAGRDLIGIAQTGSGKTAAYLLPAIVHVLAQQRVPQPPAQPSPRTAADGSGPSVLILAPTRELAEQIHAEARKLGKAQGVLAAALFGGVGKYEQLKEAKAGAHILVATPGRAVDVLRKRLVACASVTLAIIDEADRLFAMGFEAQLRSVLGQLRPDRQTLLFSATFRPRLEALARDALRSPVRVAVGAAGDAGERVDQVVEVVAGEGAKWAWLAPRLAHFARAGLVIVFAGTRAACEGLAQQINAAALPLDDGRGGANGGGGGGGSDGGNGGALQLGSDPRRADDDVGAAAGAGALVRAECIHGDKPQPERLAALRGFRRADFHVLVATDVAARGLDIPAVRTVVNYDAARDIDGHTHRIGRTGRAGADGVAYTLLTRAQSEFAAALILNLQTAGQTPPPDLVELAQGARQRGGGGGGRGAGRCAGLGAGGYGRGSGGHDCSGGSGGHCSVGSAQRGSAQHPTMAGFCRAADASHGGGAGGAAAQYGGAYSYPPPPPSSAPPPPPPPPPPKRSRWGGGEA